MKKAIALILSLAVSLIFILGASQCPQSGTTVVGYYKCTGAKAIDANFAVDAPESVEASPYGKGENIEVAVELTSRLTEEVAPGKVKVRLVGDAAIPTFFSGAKEATNQRLDAVDENCVASTEEVKLGPLKYIGEVTAKTSKNIKAQYCYEMPVKVRANLYYTDEVTEIGTNLPSGSNPASSVQVTAIQQERAKVEGGKATMDFRVTIKSLGSGMLVNGLMDCFKYEERPTEELNMKVEGAYPISCENGGKVILKKSDKTRIVQCTVSGIEPSLLGPEPSDLKVTLDGFAYQEDISPVKIWLEP